MFSLSTDIIVCLHWCDLFRWIPAPCVLKMKSHSWRWNLFSGLLVACVVKLVSLGVSEDRCSGPPWIPVFTVWLPSWKHGPLLSHQFQTGRTQQTAKSSIWKSKHTHRSSAGSRTHTQWCCHFSWLQSVSVTWPPICWLLPWWWRLRASGRDVWRGGWCSVRGGWGGNSELELMCVMVLLRVGDGVRERESKAGNSGMFWMEIMSDCIRGKCKSLFHVEICS